MKIVFLLFLAAAAIVAVSAGTAESPESVQAAVRAEEHSVRAVREANQASKQETHTANGGKAKKASGKGKQKKAGKAVKGKKKSGKSNKGTKKNNKQQKSKSTKKNGNKKTTGKKKTSGKKKANDKKKSGKKTEAGKKSEKHNTGKTSGKKSLTSPGKQVEKQTTTCGVADVVAAIKKFILYTNNYNQNKRIRTFLTQTQQKFNKAPTAFTTAASILSDATNGGQSCNGGAPNSTVSAINNKLSSCATTAAALCNISLSTADNSTVTSCATSLNNYITSFQACVANGSCSCFQSLTNLSASCENHTAILTPLTAKKTQCITSGTSGSFGDCRQQQINSMPYATGCKCPGPISNITTVGPNTLTTKAVGRLFRNREFFKFNKINI